MMRFGCASAILAVLLSLACCLFVGSRSDAAKGADRTEKQKTIGERINLRKDLGLQRALRF